MGGDGLSAGIEHLLYIIGSILNKHGQNVDVGPSHQVRKSTQLPRDISQEYRKLLVLFHFACSSLYEIAASFIPRFRLIKDAGAKR